MPSITHTVPEIVQQLLVSLSLGVLPSSSSSPTWPIYALNKPSSPDNVIVVYEAAGVVQSVQFDGYRYQRYGITIMVRSLNPTTASNKAKTIAAALDAVAYNLVDFDSTLYRVHSFSRSSPVIDVGEEKPASNRRLYNINGTVAITNIT